MVTVADALKHELFRGARVVAGSSGLARKISWVHNSGVPDASNWVNGGELVLTTALNIPQEPDEQRKFLQALADKEVAGVAITVGRYIECVPDYLREVADKRNLPLIEIPYEARFVDIARTVNESIAEQNMQMVRDALRIHQTLTQIVLDEGGLQDLAERLADLVGHSISIETDRFDAIATVNISEVDEARRYTQLHGRTDPRLIEALENQGILPGIRETLRPMHLKAMPDVGLEMERLLAPVVVHGEIYGFMWIIADDHALSELDMMAIESGSTIAALMILYRESVQSAEASLKGSLLSRLIQGDVGRETILTDQSLRYGVDLRLPYVMIIIDSERLTSQELTRLYRRVNQFVATGGWGAVVGQFAGQAILLVQAERQAQLAERLVKQAINDHAPQEFRVAISAVHQGLRNVSVAHEQCQDTLQIARRLRMREHIVDFQTLGYLHALYHAGLQSLQGNRYVAELRRLFAESPADLFHTLEVYLDAGGNGVQAADILRIHRSTLNYRLSRIVEICSVDLSDPLVRMNLQVALKLMRLFEVE